MFALASTRLTYNAIIAGPRFLRERKVAEASPDAVRPVGAIHRRNPHASQDQAKQEPPKQQEPQAIMRSTTPPRREGAGRLLDVYV